MSHYFSVIRPCDGEQRQAIVDLNNHSRYDDHQWLWKWFQAPRGTNRDFIFRRHVEDKKLLYYVVSSRPAQERRGAWQADSIAYSPQIRVGEPLRFIVRANLTVRHGREGKSQRHDVVMNAKKIIMAKANTTRWRDVDKNDRPSLAELVRESSLAWLNRRSAELGIELDSESFSADGYQQSSVADRKTQFSSIELSGQLVVTDTERFETTLFSGIGRSRAFGCGLMLVKRN